jgi:glycine oxidase
LSSRVVVVGGGITGAFSAYFLARRGAEAILVERDGIGSHASGQNPGGLNPLYGPGIPGPMEPLSLEAFRLHLEHWDAIEGLSGLDFGGRRSSRLHLADGAGDRNRLEPLRRSYDGRAGFSAEWLRGEELLAIEPRLGPGARQGLLTAGDARVDAQAYTRAVARSAENLGATTVSGEARGLHGRRRRATGVMAGEAPLPCDGVVISSGPWCEGPSRWLRTPLPIEPVRGQMVVVEPPGGGVEVDIASGPTALYGTGGEEVLVGGTEERVGFDASATAAARASLLERAAELMPAIAEAPVLRQTSALRPLSPDGAPVVGLAPGWENVCLAIGGGRKGFLLSAAIGRAAADLICAGSTELPIGPCSPGRFEGNGE